MKSEQEKELQEKLNELHKITSFWLKGLTDSNIAKKTGRSRFYIQKVLVSVRRPCPHCNGTGKVAR